MNILLLKEQGTPIEAIKKKRQYSFLSKLKAEVQKDRLTYHVHTINEFQDERDYKQKSRYEIYGLFKIQRRKDIKRVVCPPYLIEDHHTVKEINKYLARETKSIFGYKIIQEDNFIYMSVADESFKSMYYFCDVSKTAWDRADFKL